MKQNTRLYGVVAMVGLAVLLVAVLLWVAFPGPNPPGPDSLPTSGPSLPPAPVESGAPFGGSISLYDSAQATTLNPLFAVSMADHRVHELIFDRLYFRNSVTNEPDSQLVVSSTMSPDGLRWTMRLRDDVTWHDGQPFAASDVCFTVNALLDPESASSIAAPYRRDLHACEADDDAGVAILTFTHTLPFPEDRLGFYVLPAHAFPNGRVTPDQGFSHQPIGTGIMNGRLGRGGVSLTRASEVTAVGQIERLTLSGAVDPFVQVHSLMAAGVQGVVTVPPALRSDLLASDDIALKSYGLQSWWFVAVNAQEGPLASPFVRHALDHAIDRQALMRLTIGVDPTDPNPPVERISGPFLRSSPFYNREVSLPAVSSDAVDEWMTEAGAVRRGGLWTVNGEAVSFRIGMGGSLDAEARDLLNQLGFQLAAAGFEQEVVTLTEDDWHTYALTGRLEDLDLLIGKWSFGSFEYVNPLFHSRNQDGEGALNLFNYSNPDVDAILERFDRARTDTEAQDAYHDLHALVAEDLPYLFLWTLDTKSAWRREMRGNTIAPYYYFTDFEDWRWRPER